MHEPADGVLGWMAYTPLAMAMRGSLWMYPIVEVMHIVGFVALVGAVFMFDLRVLGFSQFLSVQMLGRHVLRWSASGLLLVVPAGLMMFSAHPQDFAFSGIFLVKLCLIATAGITMPRCSMSACTVRSPTGTRVWLRRRWPGRRRCCRWHCG